MQTLILGVLPVAQWLGAANSCINPILYAFMNRKFRAGFWHLFRTCCAEEDDDWVLPTTVIRGDEARDQVLRRIRSEKHYVRNGNHLHHHATINNGQKPVQCGPMRYSQSTKVVSLSELT